jgi:SAM-dependent methyltransferase
MTQAWQKIVTDTQENPADTQLAASYILDGIPKGDTAVEIGAGVGRLMRAVAPHFRRVWGVDLSEDMVSLSDTFLAEYPSCHVLPSDGYTIPAADGTVDFVYSYITFQHMPDRDCVQSNIKEIYRVLKPGGLCRIQTIKGQPYAGAYGTGGFYGHYFESEFEFQAEFERAGFKAEVRTAPVVGTDVISIIWLTGRKP